MGAQSWRESASAAAAANNLEKTSGFQRYSPERCQLQPLRHWPWAVTAFWCPAPRHYAQSWRESHASFGRKHVASPLPLHGVLETRQRLLTATFNIGVQCRICNVRLKSFLKKCNVRIMKCLHNFIFYQSIILETNSRQNCFASSMLPSLLAYVGIKTWMKQTCLAYGQVYSLPSGHSLPWQPPKRHALKSLQTFTRRPSKKR